MNPMVIAVDTGNKNIKTPHTEPFNSGLICHGNIPPAVKSDTLYFDGDYYSLTSRKSCRTYTARLPTGPTTC